MEIRPIAHIHTEFPEKFGIPRQSGLAKSLRGRIVFEPEYRNPDALRGLEGFSHLWLIWEFSANRSRRHPEPPHRHPEPSSRHPELDSGTPSWQPTVRPPRLGGNDRLGVFATRSPFRPNPLGLSCVKLESLELNSPDGPVVYVLGADLMDGTPIYDIKPYIRYADSRPEAVCGYVDELEERRLKVIFPQELSEKIMDKAVIPSLLETLRLDPRPSYHDDAERIYGLSFAGYNVRFSVSNGVLTIVDIDTLDNY